MDWGGGGDKNAFQHKVTHQVIRDSKIWHFCSFHIWLWWLYNTQGYFMEEAHWTLTCGMLLLFWKLENTKLTAYGWKDKSFARFSNLIKISQGCHWPGSDHLALQLRMLGWDLGSSLQLTWHSHLFLPVFPLKFFREKRRIMYTVLNSLEKRWASKVTGKINKHCFRSQLQPVN